MQLHYWCHGVQSWYDPSTGLIFAAKMSHLSMMLDKAVKAKGGQPHPRGVGAASSNSCSVGGHGGSHGHSHEQAHDSGLSHLSAETAARMAAVQQAQASAIARLGGRRRGHSDLDDEESEHQADACLICGEKAATVCVFECGHNVACGMCAARVRLLSGDRRCPLCKAALEHPVCLSRQEFANRPKVVWDDFGIYGSHGGWRRGHRAHVRIRCADRSFGPF